jgi:hypothetical protein
LDWFLILRFGLLVATVGHFTQVLFNAFIVMPDLSSWHADATIAAILTTLAIASFGLHTSTIRPLATAPEGQRIWLILPGISVNGRYA